MALDYPMYETLRVGQLAPHVLQVELNRPEKLNTMNLQFWADVREFFGAVESDHHVRVVILAGAGRMFSAGLDVAAAGFASSEANLDVARLALAIRRMGKAWQQAFNNIEQCGKAVIACAHNGVFGAGIEMISACDVRFCTQDAFFSAAEVTLGMAADVGGLQRFPKVMGNQSLVRELALSGRRFTAAEALQHGFVSRVLEDKEKMLQAALELATQIASKSPIATLGVKAFLNFSRDHTVEDSLEHAITWNMAMLQGVDMLKAGAALLQKGTPLFDDLPDQKRSKL